MTSLCLPERLDLELAPHPNPVKHKAMAKRGELPLRTLLWQVTGVDLTRIDGIAPPTAQLAISEIGLDMGCFPAESNFVSWLKLAPRVPISGGKPLRKRNQGMGATRLANALRMAALSLQHSNSALGAYYRSVARKHDGAVAIFATTRKLAKLIYRALKYGHEYLDQGAKAYEERFRQSRIKSLTTNALSMVTRLSLSKMELKFQVSGTSGCAGSFREETRIAPSLTLQAP